MIDALYLIFIVLMVSYFLLDAKKESSSITLIHAVLQFVMTHLFWFGTMDRRMAGLLLLYLVLTSGIFLWVKTLHDDQELDSLRMLFRVAQWGVLVMVAGVVLIQSPYVMSIPDASWPSATTSTWTFHPLVKMAGNFLLFATLFQLVTGRDRVWTLRESMLDFGAICVFFVGIATIRIVGHNPLWHFVT